MSENPMIQQVGKLGLTFDAYCLSRCIARSGRAWCFHGTIKSAFVRLGSSYFDIFDKFSVFCDRTIELFGQNSCGN